MADVRNHLQELRNLRRRMATWEDGSHQEFVNEILENTPESYDGDDAAEAIAVTYVRDLEATTQAVRTLLPRQSA